LGDAKALGEFAVLGMKEDEAFKKNDAGALAALFTEDAVLVAPDGMFYGRQAIEKRMQTRSSGGLLPPLAASVVS
jgi:ketosteroid isomerase-like protein